jgi:hypothetical protein
VPIWLFAYDTVAHGAARVHVPASVPIIVTNTASASAVHVPSASMQTPPVHSESFVQPRHSRAAVSQIGALAVVQSVFAMQPTHAPSLAQIAWAGSLQSVLAEHAATHCELTQYGVAGSVQSADVVQAGASGVAAGTLPQAVLSMTQSRNT